MSALEPICLTDLGRSLPEIALSSERRKYHLESWDDGDGRLFRTIPLRSVGGYVLDKYPPHWVY